MAKQLSITIPDLLYSKLQMYKRSANISKLCQEAIEKFVDREGLLEDIDFIKSYYEENEMFRDLVRTLIHVGGLPDISRLKLNEDRSHIELISPKDDPYSSAHISFDVGMTINISFWRCIAVDPVFGGKWIWEYPDVGILDTDSEDEAAKKVVSYQEKLPSKMKNLLLERNNWSQIDFDILLEADLDGCAGFTFCFPVNQNHKND